MKNTDLIKPPATVAEEGFKPEDDPNWDPDAHSCRAEADDWGICTWCGATIYGSLAYCEQTGYDPY